MLSTDRPGSWFIATGRRPLPSDRPPPFWYPEPNTRRRRRSLLYIGSLALVAALFGFVIGPRFIWNPRGGDPDGLILSGLQIQVQMLVPGDAKVMSSQSSDSRWTTLGCDGEWGWTPPEVDTTFTSGLGESEMFARVDRMLTSEGLVGLRSNGMYPGLFTWYRPANGPVETISLGTSSKLPRQWHLRGDSPPLGQVVWGC